MELRIQLAAGVVAVATLSACATKTKTAAPPATLIDRTPKLKRPEVRKVWVPDQIIGDEYVSGHWKFVLEKNSVWTKEE